MFLTLSQCNTRESWASYQTWYYKKKFKLTTIFKSLFIIKLIKYNNKTNFFNGSFRLSCHPKQSETRESWKLWCTKQTLASTGTSTAIWKLTRKRCKIRRVSTVACKRLLHIVYQFQATLNLHPYKNGNNNSYLRRVNSK